MNTPFRSPHRRRREAARTAGLTLVEMLVAVTLVVLMLMLFAQIFGDTVRIMREQNSLANNDQKARSVETLIRSDLARRTFRQPRVKGVTGLAPLHPQWPVDPQRQRGYFYISENDIESAQEDVLQFTIDGRETSRNPEVISFKGRAAALAPNDFSPGAAAADANQPDWDDGNFGDNLGESHAAEVVYFLRGGNLYRRQLLLREPNQPVAAGAPAQFDAQPGPGPLGSVVDGAMNLQTRKFVRQVSGDWVPGDYLATLDPLTSVAPGHVPVTGERADFWNDFDYSAWNWWRNGIGDDMPNNTADQIAGGSDQYWLMFNSIDSLKNVPGATPFPLGMPQYRFGHRPPAPPVPPQPAAPPFDPGQILPGSPIRLSEGQPVEYLLTPTGGLAVNTPGSVQKLEAFIGRYTHQETSDPRFAYPGVVIQDGVPVLRNPMLHLLPAPSVPYASGWDSNRDSVIDNYDTGPRAGEDLILSNVDSFDIEVWDDGYSEPDINGNNILDAFEDRNGNGVRDQFPGRWVNLGHPGNHPVTGLPGNYGHYRHANNVNFLYGPMASVAVPAAAAGLDGQPGVAGVDDNNDGATDNLAELGWPYSDDLWNRVFDTWHPNATAGNVNFDQNPNDATLQAYFPGTPLVEGPPFQPLRIQPPAAGPYPSWIAQWSRLEDVNLNGMLDMGEDANGNGVLDGVVTFGTVIFPGNEDRNYNDTLDPSEFAEDVNRNGMLDPAEDVNGNGVLDPGEDLNGNGALDPGEDLNGNGVLDPEFDWNNNGVIDGPEDRNGNGVIDRDFSYYYMPVALLEDVNGNRLFEPMDDNDLNGNGVLNGYMSNLATSREPEWRREPGHTVVDLVEFDLNGNGTIEPNERSQGVVWKCFDNRIGLQMIRLTIRYRDPSSGAPRQVSIVHSFVE